MERVGHWFTTYSGIKFYPLDSRVEDICIEDIAHALSNVCRYGGHSRRHYSVAQHSVYVSLVVGQLEPEHALWGLLHDAAEAYIGDMVRPLKMSQAMAAFRDAEAGIMINICKKFGLGMTEPSIVQRVDRSMCVTEAPYVHPAAKLWGETEMPIPPESWPRGMEMTDRWVPTVAKRAFVARYEELTGKKVEE